MQLEMAIQELIAGDAQESDEVLFWGKINGKLLLINWKD
jgi:hypothetical protein